MVADQGAFSGPVAQGPDGGRPAAAAREVEFHFGLDDKPGYTCRLLRKIRQRGLRVVVLGAPDTLARLDALLWTFDVGSFLPHVRVRAQERPATALHRTPVWLVEALPPAGSDAPWARADVLVNLGPQMPPQVDGYDRLVELVGEAADDLAAGRQRWRGHQAAGRVPRPVRQSGAASG